MRDEMKEKTKELKAEFEEKSKKQDEEMNEFKLNV